MEVNIKKRPKVELGTIKSCFKIADSNNCYLRLDLSKEVAFKDVIKKGVVYSANLVTGELVVFDSKLIVEEIDLKVEEV